MKILPLLAAVTVMAPALSAGPVYRIQDLGSLGGSQMSGMAMNQFGQVAGYGLDALGNLRAFTSMGSPTDITPVWASTASAAGINGSGQVVGTTFVNGHSQATLWSNGTAQVIGGLGGPDSYFTAINGQQIAGMATTAQGQGRAVIDSNGVLQDVSLPGSSWSAAESINSGGSIAGYAMSAGGMFQAYTWSSTGGYTSLGTLGGRNSYAFGINSQGQVAGNSNVSSGYAHAFLFDGTGLHDLGTLGGNSSYGYGINDASSVVGYSSTPTGNTTHAFLFVGGVMFDLNLLVSNLTGWELTQAYAINASGQIAGTGLLNGVEHAFRLDPLLVGLAAVDAPEPGSYAMALTGLLALAGGLLFRRRT